MRRGAWGLPILLWGLPGVAKSAILRWLAEEYNMPIEVLSPAARGEGAFGVTPVPGEGGRMTYPRPDWTDKFDKGQRGIVFIDEINLAATHYAGALLGLLQDRILGSYCLGPNVRIFAAANPIELAAASGGWDLSAPAANRVGHLEWPCPDVQAWTDWFFSDDEVAKEFTNAEGEEKRVMTLWPAAWGKARGMVAGFLATNSTHLHAMPKDGSAQTSKAWPSPRSWEYAARALASAEVHDLSEVERDEFVGAFVGQGSAGEFFTWYTQANLPDSADLLDGKVSWKHKASRLDITTAVFGSAVAVCCSTRDPAQRKTRGERMWDLLAQASESSPDLIVTAAKILVGVKIFTGAIKTLSKLKPILKAAGVLLDDATVTVSPIMSDDPTLVHYA